MPDASPLRDPDAEMEANIRAHGWQGHYVTALVDGEENEALREGFVNYHTHGFDRTLGHPDFQIVIGLPMKVAHGLFWNLFRRIQEGERFRDGESIPKVIERFPVRVSRTTECGRPVLRILFPDKNGRFPGEPGVDPRFGRQSTVSVD